jgi:uncharacterized protein YyaL (SSP411 family)
MRTNRSSLFALSLTATLAACAPAAPARNAGTTKVSAATVDPQQGAPKEPLPWADFSPATFARAKAERRFVVMDGSAEWCHWCHVMEATTYHDPAIKKLLAERFIQVKVDVDSRPDLEERYGEYGWPATVIFSPDAEELGKYRGYLPPEKFVEILREVLEAPLPSATRATSEGPRVARPLPEEELAWIERFTEVELGEYYDEDQGGWGRSQKAPLAWDNAWALSRARRDSNARERVLFTLDHQAKLIDPVWGGIYQYSAASDWDHAHFEKLMTFQAGALDNYAAAYALTHDAAQLARANAIRGYIDQFLKSPDGGFYATQDADLNAHDTSRRFLSGHDYYAKPDAERRALGIPRVDTHEYARENGLAISAYVTLYEAAGDAKALATAETAAARVLATHASRGALTHDADPKEPLLYLADNASMGFALVRLYEATKKPAYLDAATALATFLVTDLEDKEGGAFYAHTADRDAVGVFAARRKPFEENVMAIRFLARLVRAGRATDTAPHTIACALRAIATPEGIKGRGRMLGDFLLALEETKGVRDGK